MHLTLKIILIFSFFGIVACSSLAMAQEGSNKISTEEFLERKLRFKTRKYLTSGGPEYSPNQDPQKHSPFSRQFLEALRGLGGSNGILTTAELKGYMEVLRDLPQMGNFGSYEPGSDFLFNSGPNGNRKNYALIIGINDYEEWTDLTSPVVDAKAIASDLTNDYGFEVDLLFNPSRLEIEERLRQLNEKQYSPGDQLLILFAGHGINNPLTNEGYLVPKDGKLADPAGDSYLSYAQLSTLVDKIPCKHIMLVLDACYGAPFANH